MSTKLRRELEQRIVRAFVRDALKAGYALAVSLERGYDVETMLLGCRDEQRIMTEIFSGDECHVFLQPHGAPIADGQVVSDGWVYLVFANDGWDCISDYTTNLEPILKAANALAKEYA